MCEFCGRVSCTLTKEQVLERGNIIEDNASGIMQTIEDEDNFDGFQGNTYSFAGVPCYDSLSALIPDEDEEDPHKYMRYVFDEDEGTGGGWMQEDIDNPLGFQTEQEFLASKERRLNL